MVAQTIPNSSFSIVEYLCSVSDSVREAYAIGLSVPIFINKIIKYKIIDKIAPKATSEGSVVNMNSLLKSGYCNMGAFISMFLQC